MSKQGKYLAPINPRTKQITALIPSSIDAGSYSSNDEETEISIPTDGIPSNSFKLIYLPDPDDV